MPNEHQLKCLAELKAYREKKALRYGNWLAKHAKKKQKRIEQHKNERSRKGRKYARFVRIIHESTDRCELCGFRICDGALLVAHHMNEVNGYPEQKTDRKNGLLICTICHAEIHPWLRPQKSKDYLSDGVS